MRSRRETDSENVLIQQCLAGDERAWQLLFERYHPQLLRVIAKRLGPARKDEDLAEEIAERVWCSLVAKGSRRLRLYNPEQASFITFLGSLARQEIQRYFRRRSRRGLRQLPLLDSPVADSRGSGGLSGTFLEEFLATLSPQESSFLQHQLTGRPPPAPSRTLSPVNLPKLKQRVKAKLSAFLHRE